MITWLDKIRAMSLDDLYMVDEPLRDLPPHRLWQCPLVAGVRDDDLAARVRRAGELWLINQDLRPYNELVIQHVERAWFMAFQRAARPDEGHLLIGPYPHRILRPGEAQRLWDLPLCYRETEQATSRDLWRQLARM